MTTILIVDTRPTDRQPYTTLLSSFGYRVLEAGDGSEALELARTELPDLVITEIIMPNMDGFTLTRRLRAEPLLAGVPVIFQTVHYLEAEVRKLATASGIKHILGKPAEPQEILQAVNEFNQGQSPPICLKPGNSSVSIFNCWRTSSMKKIWSWKKPTSACAISRSPTNSPA